METIFNFNPTDEELQELFSYNKDRQTLVGGFSIIPDPISDYEKNTSEEGRLFDIAKLLEYRSDKRSADFWSKIPDIERQYRAGFDNQQIPV